ncbi:MAG TPA: NlpC/P60 family protein, partial [Acidimicrobiales bacterium]|nr:NlpC/P60 family protein [Acidimicrobiales bacterium]
MTDVMSAVGSVKQLTATLANLGPELSAAAPNGNFGAVLSKVNAELAAANDGGVVPSASGAATGLSTNSLLGGDSSGGLSALYRQSSSGGPTGDQVVSDAEKYLGVPYVWGGTNPATGLDCSGLVQHVYGELGINLPRTSQEQAQVGTPVASLADAQPGDLVFFAGSDGTASAPGHVGIYIGNGQMIDAPHTGTHVRIESVGNPVSIRRVLPGAAAAPASMIDLTGAGVFGAPSTGPAGLSASPVSPVSPGMNSLGVPASLQPLFEAAGQRYGVNPLLLASVAKQESGFQTGVVSSAGAVG